MIGHPAERGFTILEVILATAVAGFVLLALTGMINGLTVVNDRARDLTLANALAENKIESLRSIGFVGVPEPPATVDFTGELPLTLGEPRSASYEVSATADANIHQIDLVIEYAESGNTRRLEYTTLIGELGVGQY